MFNITEGIARKFEKALSDRGLVFVPDKENLKELIINFYEQDVSFFDDLDIWCRFFCSHEPSIMEKHPTAQARDLVDYIDQEFYPKNYPCVVTFDFQYLTAFNIIDAVFECVTLPDLGIKYIEFKSDNYVVQNF